MTTYSFIETQCIFCSGSFLFTSLNSISYYGAKQDRYTDSYPFGLGGFKGVSLIKCPHCFKWIHPIKLEFGERWKFEDIFEGPRCFEQPRMKVKAKLDKVRKLEHAFSSFKP